MGTGFRDRMDRVRKASRKRPFSRLLQSCVESGRKHRCAPHRSLCLYDALFALVPSPVVALNRAVAVVFDTDRQRGLAAVEELRADKTIANHYLFASVRDDLLVRLGRPIEGACEFPARGPIDGERTGARPCCWDGRRSLGEMSIPTAPDRRVRKNKSCSSAPARGRASNP